MQMFHEGCQRVEENLLSVSNAQDKQFQEMKNNRGRESGTWLSASSRKLSSALEQCTTTTVLSHEPSPPATIHRET